MVTIASAHIYFTFSSTALKKFKSLSIWKKKIIVYFEKLFLGNLRIQKREDAGQLFMYNIHCIMFIADIDRP